MAAIAIHQFRGMVPRTADRLLGDGFAVDAANVNLSSGEIRPLRPLEPVNTPSVSGPWLSVYRAEHEAAQVWLAWPRDVDVSRAPISTTAEPRYVWSGDGEPRHARFQDLPGTAYAMGIPKPKAAPSLSHSGGTGAAQTRVYGYTFYSAWDEESALSPASALITGKVDGTWAVGSMDAFPASSGTGTASHAAGVTTFANTGNHWLRPGDEVVINGTRLAVSTTPTNATFTVPGNFASATAWARVAAWNTAGMKRRLYRSEGSTGSWQLVHDDVGSTYNDTLTSAQIMGDELISSDWDPPPTNLQGIGSLPSGAMYGFYDNQLCFSEPYQPHAWPARYRRTTDFEIVGAAAFGSTVVACTAGKPYIADGVEPGSVVLESVDQLWPCLSKRGVVSVGDGVMYPTRQGLAYVGANAPTIWTSSLYTREEWASCNPASMVGAVADGRVFMRWVGSDGDQGTMVFYPAEAAGGMTMLSLAPDEWYADPRNGLLYLTDDTGIQQYDAGDGTRMSYSWLSKEYALGKPMNFGAAKVDMASEMSEADFAAEIAAYEAAVAANNAAVSGYAGVGAINGAMFDAYKVNGSNIASIAPPDVASLTFTLYVNGVAKFSRLLVADQRAFRLPAGFKSDTVAIGLTGALRVKSVKLASTMQELAQV